MRGRPILPALPLRWRLVLTAAAALAVVLVAFGVLLDVKLGDRLVATTAQDLRLSAQPAIAAWAGPPKPAKGAAAAARSLPAADVKPLQDLARHLTTNDTAALTLTADGTVVGDGPALTGDATVPAPRLSPAIYRAVAASGQERHVRQNTSAGPILVELIPLTRSGVSAGVLQLSTPLRSVDAFLATLRAVLLLGTLAAIGATILLTIPLVRGVLRPLRRMAATSRAIAAGDLGRRVAVPAGGDELSDLARAFNEMVARLETLLATQRRFLADASHELRTPLTALGGSLDVLQMGAAHGDGAAQARLLRLMEGEVARMGRLVDDLLVLTRFDADPAALLTLTPVDLGELARDVAETTRLLAPDRTVTVAIEAAPGSTVTVPGDVDRLRQALLNLCANARAHTPPGGAIAITVRRVDNEATVAVADTGAGIAPADLPRVWDRFYRADAARARQTGQGGLGLGLAIVQAIVGAHGGRATIASTPGAGTTVSLILPSATTAPAPIAQPPIPARPSPA